jgi:hypothetical protein
VAGIVGDYHTCCSSIANSCSYSCPSHAASNRYSAISSILHGRRRSWSSARVERDVSSCTYLAGLAAAYGSVAVRVVADGGVRATELFKMTVSGAVGVLVRIARLGEDLRCQYCDEKQFQGASATVKRGHFDRERAG